MYRFQGSDLKLGDLSFLVSSEVFLVKSNRIAIVIYPDSHFVPFFAKEQELGGVFLGGGDYTVTMETELSGKFQTAVTMTHPKDWRELEIHNSLTRLKENNAQRLEDANKKIIEKAKELFDVSKQKARQYNIPEGFWSINLNGTKASFLLTGKDSGFISLHGAFIGLKKGRINFSFGRRGC